VAFSPDGKSMVTGTENDGLCWEIARPEAPHRWRLAHGGSVRSVAFSRDGKTILTGSDDTTARRWDATSGAALGSPLNHSNIVRRAAFSPDPNNTYILTGSDDRSVRLWQLSANLEMPQREFVLWTQVLTGMELDDKGRTRPLTAEEWHKRRQRLREFGVAQFP